MVQASNTNKENVHISTSFVDIGDALINKKKKYHRKKMVCFILLLLLIFLTFLYLSLPVFHLESLSISGLRNLTKDTIYEMMEVKENSSYLTFDKNEAETNLKKNSNGILVSVDFNTDLFSGNLDVIEDFPLAYYNDEVYFASGRKKNDVTNLINGMNFDDVKKNSYLKAITEKCDVSKLAHFYFKYGNSSINDEVFTNFINVKSTILDNFKEVVYKSETNSTLDIVYYDDETANYYIFEDILYDKIDKIFKSDVFEKETISACRNFFKNKTKSAYKISDDNIKEAYKIKIIYNSDGSYNFIDADGTSI